jgi:uncharacterized protein
VVFDVLGMHYNSNRMPNAIRDNPLIQELVRRIVQTASPSRVILFGSHARGTSRPDSDYDFLVVASVKGSRRQLRRAIYHSLYGLGVAKDIIVATPEDIEKFGHLIGSILKPALEEGITVYERAA